MYHLAQQAAGMPESLAFPLRPRVQKAMSLKQTSKSPPSTAANDGEEDYSLLLKQVGDTQDKQSFEKLFNYYAPRVKSFMLKNGMDETAAEEVVQNTFVSVWEKAASYNPQKAAASTWIFTVARNKRIDALRRDKNTEVNSDSPAIELAAYEPAEEAYAEAEDVEKLNAAIESLPPEQADLLRLSFFDDKSHSDIAKERRLPLGTVKSRLRLALEKLRGILVPKGGKA